MPAPTDCWPTIQDWRDSIQQTDCTPRIDVHDAYSAERLFRSPPIHLDDELDGKFVCELRKQSPATFVLEYLGGRCWGTAGTIISPDNRVLSDMSHEFRERVEDYKIFKQPSLRQPRHLPGTAVVLAAPAGHVFGHFLFDVLPRLAILEKAGFNWRDADHFIISGPFKTFQQETLELLGIDASKVADCSVHPHWTADRMLIPSRSGN